MPFIIYLPTIVVYEAYFLTFQEIKIPKTLKYDPEIKIQV